MKNYGHEANLTNLPKQNNKLYVINYILVALWIALMGIIIWFSDQPDYVSQEQSLTVGKWLCNIVVHGYESMNQTTQIEYAKMLDHFVRKSAHFCEFAALGALTYNAVFVLYFYLTHKKDVLSAETDRYKKLFLFGKPLLTRILLSVLWCALFAASDEFHQLFVIGRYSSPLDVLLDTCGSATGIMFIVLIIYLIRRAKSGHTKSHHAKSRREKSHH